MPSSPRAPVSGGAPYSAMRSETNTPALIEASFADAIGLIFAAEALPRPTRTGWVCSLRQVAKAMDRPPESIPARLTAIGWPLKRLHHAQLGMESKTLTNHKANTRAALEWLAGDKELPRRGTPLVPTWKEPWNSKLPGN